MTASHKFSSGKKPAKHHFKTGIKKDQLAVLVIAYVIAFVIIVLTVLQNLPQHGFSIRNFKLDEPAPEDFIVQRDDITYIDDNATREKKEAVARLVSPVFMYNSATTAASLERFDAFYQLFFDGVAAGSSSRVLQTNLQYHFPDMINFFGENEISAIASLFPDDIDVFQSSRKLLNELMERGLFDDLDERKAAEPELFTTGKLEILRDKSFSNEIPLNTAIQLSTLQQWIDEKTKTMPLDEIKKSLVRLFIYAFAGENCFYDKEATLLKQSRARNQVPPEVVTLIKGKPVVRKDEIVTAKAMAQIIAHGESDISLNINVYVETAIYLVIIYAVVMFLLSRTVSGIKLKKNQVYLFTGTALFFLLLAALFNLVPWESEWIPYSVLLPANTLAMIITIIIAPGAGVVFSLLCALLVLMVHNMDVNAFLFTFLTGVAGCFVALRAEKRIDLIRSGFYLSFFSFIVLCMLGFINNFRINQILLALGWGGANGFIYGILSFGLLPGFEHLLNAATRFRLMELSDLNAPIFKKMLTMAPGTYNHSVLIANLAESAATEIGANPLLARVGAYYHDIGKIDQADYFIENQRAANKHDELKPTLSAAVIKSHVKIGIEKAQELGLPSEVVDIIAQHHGKGVIAYFYQRAISENKTANIAPSEFSYTTPRPRTKEAALVMLADVIEAASRTLRRPTIAKLEKFIWNIIMEKFITGELSESGLTLNDLESIKNRFVQLMAGHFHTRIEYPKKKEAGK